MVQKSRRKQLISLKSLGTPCLVHQPSYSMFNRWVEDGLLDILDKNGVGSVVFSPLFQGLLTDKYLNEIPEDSRVAKPHGFLKTSDLTSDKIKKVKALNEIALKRGQKLAQMALAWVLRDNRVTSVIIGASKVSHITDAVNAQTNLHFSSEELVLIENVLNS
jgi:L-glyceraldehyde 3-phosphate reductase